MRVTDVDDRATIARCARHLGRVSRSTIHRLACDVLLLLHGIRDAILYDYTADNAAGAPRAFLESLAECFEAARDLVLLVIGESFFFIMRGALAKAISRILRGDDGGTELVAVDSGLPAPRPCTAAERRAVHAVFFSIASEIRVQLNEHEQPSHAQTPRQLAAASPLVLKLQAPTPPAAMVAIHGWLLGYPSIFCYAREAPTAGTSCLGGVPLAVVQLIASCPATLRTAGAAQAPTSHLVCSFSVPATEENVAEKPILQDWRDDARRRFAAQTYWQLERMSVETRVHEHVVL